MGTVHTLVLVAHVLIGALIVGLVLLQRGKGAEVGAAFGSGASGTVFGAKGSANFLSRSTAVLAALFFVTSLSLAYLGTQRPVAKSVVDKLAIETPLTPAVGPPAKDAPRDVPVTPAAPAPGQAPATQAPQSPPGGGNPAP
jgi:preprotein translocase subunit SecG